MSYKKIKEGLYSVGVLNPNLRFFDVVMRTDFGTSYNSYLIKDKKNALIDTCHDGFFEEYIENIGELIPLSAVDYIILNHTEPDHSGALARLLKLCKNAKVYCSRPASIYLKAITNGEMVFNVVKDGDVLSLGDKELRFISAPFLHWPDTMFTYCERLSAVFTCDFLGSHFCEPNMTDRRISYPEKFLKALKGYYDDIFSPFPSYVADGLKKLYALKFDTACVSHGPVLTRKGTDNFCVKDTGRTRYGGADSALKNIENFNVSSADLFRPEGSGIEDFCKDFCDDFYAEDIESARYNTADLRLKEAGNFKIKETRNPRAESVDPALKKADNPRAESAELKTEETDNPRGEHTYFPRYSTAVFPENSESGLLNYALKKYAEWSAPEKSVRLKIPVFYCSAYGYTKKLALTALSELKRIFPSAETAVYDASEGEIGALAEIMNSSDGFMIGSPTLNRNAVPPVLELLARLDMIGCQKKPVGVFGSYGWSGEAVPSICAWLNALRIKVIGEGLKINFNPSADDLEKMRVYTGLFADGLKTD
ncbi:MAG: FprA family A-type flavoprotein [Clostridiales bacterium]|jgi:flavorubredoxin|nr:FprA family A-type flavoprotein [Clostridiales bacterium]